MTINYDPTTEQEAAIARLRKYYDKKNGTTTTNKAFAEARCVQMFDQFVAEAQITVDREGLAADYKTATPEVRAQIDTLLGR